MHFCFFSLKQEPSSAAKIKPEQNSNQNLESFEAQQQQDYNKEHVLGPSRSKIHHRSSKIDVFDGYVELISGTFTSCGGEVSSRGVRIKVPVNAIKKNIQSVTILVTTIFNYNCACMPLWIPYCFQNEKSEIVLFKNC